MGPFFLSLGCSSHRWMKARKRCTALGLKLHAYALGLPYCPGGEEDASLGWKAAEARRGTGLRRRRRRGASGPNAFLLVRQGGEGVAVARQGRGVRHVGAGRCGTEGSDRGVPERRTVCGAWLNQQFGW